MGTLRNIRIATGNKKIELEDENLAIIQISEILKEHRAVLIDRLINDLPTYINYKFPASASKEKLDHIKNRLSTLKFSNVSFGKYTDIIGEILSNESTYVKSEPFYMEINEVIAEELNPMQLMLVK
jgi:hypothetical protein